MTSCTIETDKLILGMDSLREALLGQGQDARNLVQDETRILARTIVAFVPPVSNGKSAKQIGELAVESDLKDLITEVNQTLIDEVGSKYGITDIKGAYLMERTGERVQLEWEHIDPTGNRLDEYHAQYRNKDGRIPKSGDSADNVWSARVVVPYGTRDPFIAKIKAHVGHFKATWAKAGAILGDRSYPRWITNHFGTQLGILNKDGLSNPEAPTITFGSRAQGNQKIAKDVQKAVNARVKNLAAKVKLALSGYSRDLAKGMRAQARASQQQQEQGPSVE